MKPPFQALIFDCDGTLADTMPLHYQTWCKALNPLGILFPEELFYAWAGIPTRDIIHRLSEEQGIAVDVETAAHEKERHYLEELPSVRPIEPVVAIVREHAGILPMAVASGSLRPTVMKTLRVLGLSDSFAAIVTAEDVRRQKPAPDIFLEAARRLGIPPDSCCGYEDGDLGLEAIRAAGMAAVDIRLLR
ncbi:MAG: HAD family phosphatase [Kiritimatiellae bacterium]|nr:HAD family phosphatase [Kiritimatiellia bacterium]MDD4737036.1 HAD family phosphatase [Kiritimatiellia bacterium]